MNIKRKRVRIAESKNQAYTLTAETFTKDDQMHVIFSIHAGRYEVTSICLTKESASDFCLDIIKECMHA